MLKLRLADIADICKPSHDSGDLTVLIAEHIFIVDDRSDFASLVLDLEFVGLQARMREKLQVFLMISSRVLTGP